MELLLGGSLKSLIGRIWKGIFDHITSENIFCLFIEGQITDLQASTIFKGILSAVQYIHEKGIVHWDLKPGNLLKYQTL